MQLFERDLLQMEHIPMQEAVWDRFTLHVAVAFPHHVLDEGGEGLVFGEGLLCDSYRGGWLWDNDIETVILVPRQGHHIGTEPARVVMDAWFHFSHPIEVLSPWQIERP